MKCGDMKREGSRTPKGFNNNSLFNLFNPFGVCDHHLDIFYSDIIPSGLLLAPGK